MRSQPGFLSRSLAALALVAATAMPSALLIGTLTSGSPAHAFGEAEADSDINQNPLKASARLQPSAVAPGGTAEILIDLTLPEGYKAYVDRFKLSFESHDDIKIAPFKVDPVIEFMDSVSKKMKKGIGQKATMRALIEIPQGFKAGDVPAKLKIGYQACTKEFCLFPKSTTIDLPFKVDPAAVVGKPSGAAMLAAPKADESTAGASDSGSGIENAMKNNIFLALALVFGMGFLTSLTPCIYPMIPITLAVLGARTKGQSKAKSFSISLSYVLGIAFTYSIMGVAAAKTGALFGSALGNVYVVTAIGFLFVVMGLSMYGLFELQVPGVIRDKLGSQKGGSGYGGAFATGLLAGVVASPCVGPVLVGVLTYIAQTQDVVLGFFMLFTFALGMGILFIVLGTSSAMISKLPKAGGWMESVKFVFGTVMVGMALYYVKPVYPTWLFHCLLGLAIVLIASAYGAFEPSANLSGSGRVRKGAAIASFVIGLAFALSGFSQQAGLGLPGIGAVAGAGAPANASYAKLDWKPYSEEALASALKSGKPVLVDFYADWCGACKELEQLTFTDARIRDISSKFVLIKIDATEDFPGLAKLKSEYKVMGLPTMVFFDSTGKRRNDLTVTGFENADKFFARMTSVVETRSNAQEISHASSSEP